MPPEGGGGEDIPREAEKRAWHHDRASLIASWSGVPPVHCSPRCAWGWGVAWDAGLPHKTLLQPPNAGTAEPVRVSPPEAVAYLLELRSEVLKQTHKIVGVFFFHRQDALHQAARGRI